MTWNGTAGERPAEGNRNNQAGEPRGRDNARDGRPVPGGDAPVHLPPQDLASEEAILGAMLMSPRAIEVATDLRLREADFYRPNHRLIFRTILELEGQAVDELTVVNELKRRSRLTEAGGAPAIYSLAERTPSVANARAYVLAVIEQATLRSLVETGHEIARLGYEHPEEPTRLIDEAGQLVGDLSQRRETGDFIDGSTLLGPIYDELTARVESGTTSGLPSGFVDLDSRTGGFKPGQLIIVAARPGVGKTAWAMNVAEHLVLNDEGAVAVFNLEMEPRDLLTRVLCSVAKVDQKRVRNDVPLEEDWPHLVDAVGRLMQPDRLFIADTRDLTPMALRAKCRRLHTQLRHQGGLKLIIVDYLQLMESGRRDENRNQAVSYISRQLKSLALELGVPIMALSQLNRGAERETGGRPQISHLRDSGSLEQDADIVLLLYRPEVALRDETPVELQGKAELIIAKHRNGEMGTIHLGFLGHYTKFTSLTREDSQVARDARATMRSGGSGGSAGSAGEGSVGGRSGSANGAPFEDAGAPFGPPSGASPWGPPPGGAPPVVM